MDLRPLYRQMAESGDNFQGLSILQHQAQVGAMIRRFNARTLLDYGSGRGNAYQAPHEVHRSWGIAAPVLYDPAFATHDVLPPAGITFDGVICSDVLEHVPLEQVGIVIRELFQLADRFVWASVCCRPAKKSFPDGTNLHVTVKPLVWWQSVFSSVADGRNVKWALVETK